MLDAVNCAKPSHRLAASITLTYPANWPARKYLFPRVRDFGTIFSQAVSPRGRFDMLRTDLDAPFMMGPSTAARLSPRLRRLCFPGIIFVSCIAFGAMQCSAQDVAEAARQERSQKQSKQKKSKHVYTEQDLKRAQILTPEDRAQVEAKKNQPTPPMAGKSQEAVDAQSLSSDAPLEAVAETSAVRGVPSSFRRCASARVTQASSARFAETSRDAAASASFQSRSTAIRSLPAAGEALALRAPQSFLRGSGARDAFAPACRSHNAFAADRAHCSRSSS